VDPLSRSTRTSPKALPKSNKALSKSRLVRSFGFAWAGIGYTWNHEPNFRIELVVGSLAFLLALWLGVSPIPVLLMGALVLSLEILNSAIEALVDLASPDIHPLAKIAKDAAAGAVFLASVLALIIGLVWMGPRLLQKLGW
jgi:diacylglycerol kinase (ATP)